MLDGYRIHLVDEGNGPAVLLQHGNPMWCFLWRKIIPILLNGGIRVVAPDLVGLGLSDKPRNPKVHSLEFHGRLIATLVSGLGVEKLTIVGQDWGGPVTGYAASLKPEGVAGAVFANTSIRAPSRAPRVTRFHRFSHLPMLSTFVFRVLNFPIPFFHLAQGNRGSIGRKERHAYRFPLRSYRDRVAPLALARMVPTTLDHPTVECLRRVERWAESFNGPVRLVWGTRDPILGRSLKRMRGLFPDARVTETDAGHYLQEEVPEILAQAILDVVEVAQRTPQALPIGN
jgi:haloalkane dehalogenase